MPDNLSASDAGILAALGPLSREIGDTSPEDREWNRCAEDTMYFIRTYCHIFHKDRAKWLLFEAWACQEEMVGIIRNHPWVIACKARQLGQTWIVLCYVLWLVIFHPVAQWLLFSIGDREAKELTGFRLKGMCDRLPKWIHDRVKLEPSAHELKCSNGSRVMSMPSNAGHSYAATGILIDEADRTPDLDTLLAAAEPAVEGGGQMILLSTSDKSKPLSRFKNIYRLAKKGESNYVPVFYPWNADPRRTREWYEKQRKEVMISTGALDAIWEQYPSTDTEALAPNSLDKRIASTWLNNCFAEIRPIPLEKAMRRY